MTSANGLQWMSSDPPRGLSESDDIENDEPTVIYEDPSLEGIIEERRMRMEKSRLERNALRASSEGFGYQIIRDQQLSVEATEEPKRPTKIDHENRRMRQLDMTIKERKHKIASAEGYDDEVVRREDLSASASDDDDEYRRMRQLSLHTDSNKDEHDKRSNAKASRDVDERRRMRKLDLKTERRRRKKDRRPSERRRANAKSDVSLENDNNEHSSRRRHVRDVRSSDGDSARSLESRRRRRRSRRSSQNSLDGDSKPLPRAARRKISELTEKAKELKLENARLKKLLRAQHQSLSTWLHGVHLHTFEEALREDLGVTTVAQLHDLKHADWKSIGVSEAQIQLIVLKLSKTRSSKTPSASETSPNINRQNSHGLTIFQAGLHNDNKTELNSNPNPNPKPNDNKTELTGGRVQSIGMMTDLPHRQSRQTMTDLPHRQSRQTMTDLPHHQSRQTMTDLSHHHSIGTDLSHRQSRQTMTDLPHHQSKGTMTDLPHPLEASHAALLREVQSLQTANALTRTSFESTMQDKHNAIIIMKQENTKLKRYIAAKESTARAEKSRLLLQINALQATARKANAAPKPVPVCLDCPRLESELVRLRQQHTGLEQKLEHAARHESDQANRLHCEMQNVHDLKQQLASLYTAYQLLEKEYAKLERATQHKKSQQEDADFSTAMSLHLIQKKQMDADTAERAHRVQLTEQKLRLEAAASTIHSPIKYQKM